ncbi:DNA-binding protein [Clostridium sporogenes]|uniref:DNA-binding protein n=1 Tax=Clostridium sporogenes TaxID=1509 RepID=UPI003F90872E
MKKILSILIIGILSIGLVACGSTQTNNEENKNNDKPKQEQTKEESMKEESQEELNKKIKNSAVKADFVKINGHEKELKGKSYYIEGEVTFIDSTNSVLPKFTVKTKEGEGYGMYDVENFGNAEVKEGDKIKVYGKLDEDKSETGAPQISGNVIEKQK